MVLFVQVEQEAGNRPYVHVRQDEQAVEEEPHEQQEVHFGELWAICMLWTPYRTAHLLITHHTPANSDRT